MPIDKKLGVLAISAGVLVGANAVAQDSENLLEEITVTGSYIKSSRSDAASPVDVVDAAAIRRSGAFTIGEITAKLSVNSGSENNADSFTSGATQGTSNVNLRGLGLSSTLVLVNGRRQTIAATIANDGSVFVDTSTIPLAALDRVEVLKEGAASAYGSDAVAGVVNYILKKDFDGFEINGGYQSTTSDSQDTTEASFLWGFGNDQTRVNVAGAIMRQDPLSVADRPFIADNAISTLGRSFILLGGDTVAAGDYAGTYNPGENVPDPNCAANGGSLIPQASGARCGFFYGPRFNIVNEEERNQLYTNVVHEFSDSLTLTAELGYTKNKVLDNPQSPSYPNLSFPVVLPGQAGSPFNVPVVWLGRPLGSEAPSPLAPRENETWRAVLELDGSFNDNWSWNGALTYSSNERENIQPDTISSRLSNALAGTGGASGTETFNIFDPAANSAELIDFISVDTVTNRESDLTVLDFVTSGELFEMSAGAVGFAAGVQYRDESYSVSRNEIYTQTVDPVTGAAIPVDLIFLGGGFPLDESRSSYAAFAEMQIPVTENLEMNLAVRYEDLETDSSVDPKLSLRWQATDDLVLRGSVSTAFREPSLSQFSSLETSLQGIQDFNPDGTPKGGVAFIRVTSAGNAQLVPEESTNYNFGAIWSPTDNLDMRIDYWRFEYENVITIESAQGKIISDLNGPDVVRLAGDNSQLVGINANYINAATVDTDGLDIAVNYIHPTDIGDFGIHFTGTRTLSYEIPDPAGGVQDVAGLFNHDNFARSIPETKANLSFDWANDSHSAALTAYYVDSYETTRAVPATASANIDSWVTVDLQYAYNLDLADSEAVITFGLKNIFDEEPPVVYDAANYSYDPKHHDPRGRLFYVRGKYRF
ncbi:MAG: TonB-dependent receptor plug domain-containing protein [Pseudomonadales bacterium]